MKIIGFSGKIGVGKNYIAENIIGKMFFDLGYVVSFLAFADLVKYELGARLQKTNSIDDVINSNTVNYNNLFITKTHDIRLKLQKYATEHGRNSNDKNIDDIIIYYDTNIWIKGLYLMMKNIYEKSYNKDKHIFIITDVRFINEAEFIKKLGGLIIRINSIVRNHKRLTQESSNSDNPFEMIMKISTHQSEIELDNYTFDFIIDNDKSLYNNHSIFENIINFFI